MKNDYETRGETTAIFLKNYRNKEHIETIIDTSDLEKAKEYEGTWWAWWSKTTQSYYVHGFVTNKGKVSHTKLHRHLMDYPEGLVIDHINFDTLNNTRKNLRAITNGQNQQNRKGAHKNSLSGIRGVAWNKGANKWQAQLQLEGKKMYLGIFDNLEEAEKTVIAARKKYMSFSDEQTQIDNNYVLPEVRKNNVKKRDTGEIFQVKVSVLNSENGIPTKIEIHGRNYVIANTENKEVL